MNVETPGRLLARGPRFTALPPLSLYIHVPWCVRKCPYCDFNSHEAKGGVPEQRYVEALVADLDAALPLVWGRRIYTVFFGGGTPSLLSADAIDAILSAVRARVPLAVDAEITLEANPGTFEAEKFAGFKAAGVNRLSIGIQSFDETHLKALGRIHDSVEAHRAIGIARDTFENFNLDLMYALPGQTPEEARADLSTALSYAPPHLSLYHLTIEPNTYFHRYPPSIPDDDTAAAMQDAAAAALYEAGYEHYETSAYAKAGRRSRHNLNYWSFGDYLGIGAGAHGKLSFRDRIVREVRERKPQTYMSSAMEGRAVFESRVVGDEELPFEFMLNALRLVEGFPLALFVQRTGLQLAAIEPQLAKAQSAGLLERTLTHARPTARGQRFLNDLLGTFLPDARGGGPRRVISICSAGTRRPS